MENEEKLTKQQLWERKLLDFSLRNMLLNFRVTKNAVQIMTAGLGALEDGLSDGGDFSINAAEPGLEVKRNDKKIFEADEKREQINDLVNTEFAKKRLRTFLQPEELETNLKSLKRAAKVSMEENGTNTLYLAIGFLKWYETDRTDEEARFAPIVLVPVDIIRNMRTKEFVLRSRQEDTEVNITLLEYLRQMMDIDIQGLDPLPEDEAGVNIPQTFSVISQAIACRNGWSVENMAFIGLFSFGQFVMWNDIRNRAEDLKQNKIVRSLMEGKMTWTPEEEEITSDNMDRLLSPEDIALPVSADSSQMAAVALAADGASFVLHGPPGTGKSQTITNIIADSLYRGRSVLFVSEKMAALEVVQKRLDAIGLAPFCLEMHSNKTNKAAVLGHLEKTLETAKVKSAAEFRSTADRLHGLRDSLSYLVEAVHAKRSFGITLYEAIERFEAVRAYRGRIVIRSQTLDMATPDFVNEWNDSVREYVVAAHDIGVWAAHPLKRIGLADPSAALLDGLRADIVSLSDSCGPAQAAYDRLRSWSGLDDKSFAADKNSMLVLINMCDVVKHPAPVIEGLVRAAGDFSSVKAQVDALVHLGRECAELEARLQAEYMPQIFELNAAKLLIDWKTAEASFVITRVMKENELIKQMKIYANDPSSVTKESMTGRYRELSDLAAMKENIHTAYTGLSKILDSASADTASDFDAIEEAVTKAGIIRNVLLYIPEPLRETALKTMKQRSPDPETDESAVNAKVFITGYETFRRKYSTDFSAEEKSGDFIAELKKAAEDCIADMAKLRQAVIYNQKKEVLKDCGLQEVSQAYESGSVTADELEPSFSCGLYHGLITQTIDADDALKDFQGKQFEAAIEQYRQVMGQYRELTKDEIIARLSSGIPDGSESPELAILKKTIKNRGRMMPVRKLFNQIPVLLRQLCPCMLMSPISVAQYIDPAFPKFDLVVFDEASQLPTSEAAGTIARAENAVIVGDPKQLPPTSFFSSNRFGEDNAEEEDLESLLDDCLALSMPQQYLKWHYRSRHESLIAYSNMKYYDNRLFTFPSPNDMVSEVSLIHVEGSYDKGATKQNRAEAEAVVAEVMRRLKDAKLRNDSIGVVTFSEAQQDLIDDLLTAELEKNPDIADADAASKEPVFVKNLENVQGDERDVILFSIGYGPDKDGNVSMNFGPLNKDGGWRRLNVAITRARKHMSVYAVLKPSQIDLSKTASEGVAGLKGFLEFAERGSYGMNTAGSRPADVPHDAITDMVAEAIRGMGCEVRTNVGCSGFRVDIGVVRPDNKDAYMLGIQLDGKNCRGSATTQDRFIGQPDVLKGLGWELMRVWVIDWLSDEENVKLAIKKKLEETGWHK